MAVQALQTNVTSDQVTAGVEVVGPFMVTIPKNSVFNGAVIEIELATGDEAAEYIVPDQGAVMTEPGSVYFNTLGTNYVRVRQTRSDYDTSISVDINQ